MQEGIPQYQGLPEYGFKGMATGGMSLGGEEQPAGDARPFQHLGLLKTMFASELLKQVSAACVTLSASYVIHRASARPLCSNRTLTGFKTKQLQSVVPLGQWTSETAHRTLPLVRHLQVAGGTGGTARCVWV